MTIIPQITLTENTPTVWYGCYDGGWQNLIKPESMAHPAKYSRNLISRIYSYALERGYLKPGMVVLDCFAGVGLGALDAGANGLSYVGVELESRFYDMGQGCNCTGISKSDWIRYYGRWDKMAHKDGNHWCPQCLAEAKQVTDSQQLSFFEPEPTATYTRNSGIIPSTQPHYYRGNLDLFRKYAKPGTWAVLLNGDSRNLRAVIGQAQADGLLSSPPYEGSIINSTSNGIDWEKAGRPDRLKPSPKRVSPGVDGGLDYGQAVGQLGAMKAGSLADSLLSSPPYINSVNQSAQANDTEARIERMRQAGIDVTNRANVGGGNGVARQPQSYGSTDGQLGAMKEGDLDGLISSPPYANGEKGHPSLGSVNKDNWGQDGRDIAGRRGLNGNYGESSGQLANMSLGDSLVSSPPFAGNTGGRGEASRNGIDAALFDRHSGGMKKGTGDDPGNLDHLPMRGLSDALLSSPPFEQGSEGVMRASKFKDPAAFARAQMSKGHGCSFEAKMKSMEADNDRAHYGQTTGQLGIEQGTTFWAAAKDIVSESYLALKDDSYQFWVTKSFIRDKNRVDFPGQWRQLCEACGFEFVESIYAMQISKVQYQQELSGDAKKIQKATKSFFRRTYEKKFPDNRIDWEEVIVMRKPAR